MATGPIKFRLEIANEVEIRSQLKLMKSNNKKLFNEYRKIFLKIARDYKNLSALYAPRDTGVLERPMLRSNVSSGYMNVTYLPEYAEWLEKGSWGPDAGKTWRQGTLAKILSTGAPIGPAYGSRALRDFEKHLDKNIRFKKGIGNFRIVMKYDSPSLLR